jgi:small conductance mechanosensitive channel
MKREFNRRMKNRFDELGIEIPFPQQTISFGEDTESSTLADRPVVRDKPATKDKARNVQDRGDASDSDGGD